MNVIYFSWTVGNSKETDAAELPQCAPLLRTEVYGHVHRFPLGTHKVQFRLGPAGTVSRSECRKNLLRMPFERRISTLRILLVFNNT